MAKKIKAIVKRPNETWGHSCNVSNSLRNLQNIVGGPIETSTLNNGVVLICNEEGKIRNFPYNFTLRWFEKYSAFLEFCHNEAIFGTVIVCGTQGAEFADIPVSFADWKDMLRAWGNN